MALGYTIEELTDRISGDELAFWRAKWAVERWGEKAEWVRHAYRQALHANTCRDPKKSAYTPEDFLPEDI